ncbi:hypothetical protein BDV32DRAFT_154198 [Aspergillus pseudonomiae]|uniref:Uncharacterized protein n=1 Tax=Aspergillus pseudonomiae TaxID=1506151 RepID=A0A5N7DNN6_9EURO|nr:uncharacterized protein BDV37DRAFT_279404 [Aspergillus pseudonomiae]KAB8255521.1 hypothetical protein BDV32DRAFT_154198 [Aspergillus pseudonomiae]KAE8408034.1 hypothetical protein BDV37DRAFT_279404 [Aspergillus pseudonomiae]
MGWLYAAIAGTTESGKTTLMRLVANELLRIYGEEKPIYCLSGWPQSVYDIGWAARLEKNTGAHGRNWLNYSSYLLLDEAQLLYWHDNLWSEFFESVELLGDSWVLAGKSMRKLRSTLPPNSKFPYILKVALDLSPPRWRPVGLLLSEDEAGRGRPFRTRCLKLKYD